MSEPVKLVVFVLGGVVQDILSCGVPCEVALVDADTECDGANMQAPDLDGSTYAANGSIWDCTKQNPTDTAYAHKVFTAVEEARRE